MKNSEKKIAVIIGDPNSINSEIIFKSWKKLDSNFKKKIYFIGNIELVKKQFIKLKIFQKIQKVSQNIKTLENNEAFKMINVDLKFKDPFNVKIKDASQYIIKCLNLGHKLALNKSIYGFINCAINKNLLPKKNIGVTEYLASKCGIVKNSEVMLIKSKSHAVVPITTHLDLKDVDKNINTKIIITKIKTLQNFFFKFLKRKPRIGILGLNPHNAELRSDSKEVKVIIPAVKNLKKLKIFISGPLVADTIFMKDYKKYDVIVGMYHDQVLPSFKSIFKFEAINVTLGLKYIRVSPDHGVASNLIKKNKANAASLINCFKFIEKFCL